MLRDVVGGASLAFYTEVALCASLLGFALLCLHLFLIRRAARREVWKRMAGLPLEEERDQPAGGCGD
jgi:hypothetical protein